MVVVFIIAVAVMVLLTFTGWANRIIDFLGTTN